jgi:hypothetical protein
VVIFHEHQSREPEHNVALSRSWIQARDMFAHANCAMLLRYDHTVSSGSCLCCHFCACVEGFKCAQPERRDSPQPRVYAARRQRRYVGGRGGVKDCPKAQRTLDNFMTLNGQPVHKASNNHCEQHEQQHCGTNPRTHRLGTDLQPD